MSDEELKKVANEVRKGIVTGVHAAKSGHPGGSLSVTDLLTYLYFKEMNIDPAQPKMETRDRFVLSKGHTAPALYAVMAQRGYFPEEELKSLRKVGSRLQGHPSMKLLPGIDMSTGSLGQGISAAVGMALGSKYGHKGFRVYTVLGDGELEEGQVWEAAMFAAANRHAALDAASQRIVDHIPHGGRVQNRRAAARFDRLKAQRDRLKSEQLRVSRLVVMIVFRRLLLWFTPGGIHVQHTFQKLLNLLPCL